MQLDNMSSEWASEPTYPAPERSALPPIVTPYYAIHPHSGAVQISTPQSLAHSMAYSPEFRSIDCYCCILGQYSHSHSLSVQNHLSITL